MAQDLLIELPNIGLVQGFQDTCANTDVSVGISKACGDRTPVDKWLGIPFAHAGRWERPIQPAKWDGVLEALEYGPSPVHYHGAPDVENTWVKHPQWKQRTHLADSEDCLTLNIFRPSHCPKDKLLPVMFWVHGGGLTYGSCAKFIHEPTELVRQSMEDGMPICVVKGSYRTNLFGFFAHPDLAAVDAHGLAGNYGFYDQIAGLEWVRDNIHNFGGDTSNCTVFGESAGAFSISVLLAARLKTPLFRRAIMQSGSVATMVGFVLQETSQKQAKELKQRWRTQKEVYPQYDKLLMHFGITSTDARERVAQLRRVNANALAEFFHRNPVKGLWGGTEESGEFAVWPEPPRQSYIQGSLPGRDIEAVIMGCNRDEGTLFSDGMGLQDPEKYDQFVNSLPPPWQEGLRRLYPTASLDKESLIDSVASCLLGDLMFDGPMVSQANLMARLPVNDQPSSHLYLYTLETCLDQLLTSKTHGVHHAIDMPFVFRHRDLWTEGSPEDVTSLLMARNWLHFAYHGRPLPEWPKWTSENPMRMVFKPGKAELGDMAGWKKEKMTFWTQVLSHIPK